MLDAAPLMLMMSFSPCALRAYIRLLLLKETHVACHIRLLFSRALRRPILPHFVSVYYYCGASHARHDYAYVAHAIRSISRLLHMMSLILPPAAACCRDIMPIFFALAIRDFHATIMRAGYGRRRQAGEYRGHGKRVDASPPMPSCHAGRLSLYAVGTPRHYYRRRLSP